DALGGANDDGAVDLALLDAAARGAFLDAHLDDVANAGVATLGAAQHLDAKNGLRTGVVGDFEPGFSLDHFKIFPTCTQGPEQLRASGQSWACRQRREP